MANNKTKKRTTSKSKEVKPKPDNQNQEEEPQVEDAKTSESETTEVPDFKLLISEEVTRQMNSNMETLRIDLKSKLEQLGTAELTNTDSIVNAVMQQLEQRQEETTVPKWASLSAENAYQLCFERAIILATKDQSFNYVDKKSHCKMLMKRAVKLANEMFDALAVEFGIES